MTDQMNKFVDDLVSKVDELNSYFDDEWHEIGATDEPAFQNGWVNFNAGYAPLSFKKSGETIHVRGVVKDGSPANSVIFTLPEDYRPSASMTFAQIAGGTLLCWINVKGNGEVQIIGGGSASYTGVTLSFCR